MKCLGGSNGAAGQGFSGQDHLKSIKVFKRDPVLNQRTEPYEMEVYFRDDDLRIGPFWRFEGLDTAEKREGAIVEYLNAPRGKSIYDTATGGGE